MHQLYLTIHEKDRTLRESFAKLNVLLRGGKGLLCYITVPLHLTYAVQQECRLLDLSSPFAAQDRTNRSPFVQIWAFLSTLRLAPTQSEQQGISWIELFFFNSQRSCGP